MDFIQSYTLLKCKIKQLTLVEGITKWYTGVTAQGLKHKNQTFCGKLKEDYRGNSSTCMN